MDRPWPEGDHLSVRQAFAVEQPSLMALPEHDYPVGERLVVDAGKTPYVRFDLNDYSIPHTHVRRTLTVVAVFLPVAFMTGIVGQFFRQFGLTIVAQKPVPGRAQV